MDFDYSNKEIVAMKFLRLEEKMTEDHTETLEKISESNRINHDKLLEVFSSLQEIKLGVDKTNGSVANAFKEIQKLKTWRAGQVVGLAVVVSLGGIIIGMATYIFTSNMQSISDRFDRQSQAIIRLQK